MVSFKFGFYFLFFAVQLYLLLIYRVRLIALASQKFVADIINDTMQLNKMKGSAQASRSSKAKEKK